MATKTATANGSAKEMNDTVTETDDIMERLRVALGNQPKQAKDYKDVQIEKTGSKIVIPEDMSYSAARDWLEKKEREEDKVVAIHHEIECFPLDGAVALSRAIERTFGFAGARGRMHPWFGEQPPNIVNIQTGVNRYESVVWDRMQPPALEGGWIAASFGEKNGMPVFNVVGQVKRKLEPAVRQLVELTRQIVRNESIYKGQAIMVDLKFAEKGKKFDIERDAPQFMDVASIREDSLILNRDVEFDLATSVFVRVERTQECIRSGVPLKHGVLLKGPYGTGKTLTAQVIAKKATRNDWTFIYLKHAGRFAAALRFAQMYAPCVLFCEDIDKAVKGERDAEMDNILNSLDGVDTKNTPILTVLTTNNPEDIHPGFLRAGRIDTVVDIGVPDREAAARFIDVYARNEEGTSLLDPDVDLEAAGEALSGMVPAFIAEGVRRAKMYSLNRSGDADDIRITTDDLVKSGTALRKHIAMMEGNANTPVTDKRFDLYARLDAQDERFERVEEAVEEVHEHLRNYL